MDKKRPIKKFRGGNIQVAAWANKSTKGTWFSVTISRGYKDERGQWQDSNGFAIQDIPLLCRLLDQAYDYLYNLPRLPEAGDGGDEAMSGYGSPPESWNELPTEPA
jgi:hypothetical protein